MYAYIFFFSEVNYVQYKLMLLCSGDLRQTYSCLNCTCVMRKLKQECCCVCAHNRISCQAVILNWRIFHRIFRIISELCWRFSHTVLFIFLIPLLNHILHYWIGFERWMIEMLTEYQVTCNLVVWGNLVHSNAFQHTLHACLLLESMQLAWRISFSFSLWLEHKGTSSHQYIWKWYNDAPSIPCIHVYF